MNLYYIRMKMSLYKQVSESSSLGKIVWEVNSNVDITSAHVNTIVCNMLNFFGFSASPKKQYHVWHYISLYDINYDFWMPLLFNGRN